MSAGDNTLNCHCALLALNSLQKCEGDKLKTVFCDYFKFMTTPGTHNDTYAESWHRFFLEYLLIFETIKLLCFCLIVYLCIYLK